MSTTVANCLFARLRVGVSAATSGPGAVHLLNERYDAKLDHTPVVAILGQVNRSAMSSELAEVLPGHPQ